MSRLKIFISLYIVLVVLFIVSIILIQYIPVRLVQDNINKSAQQIQKEGIFYKPFGLYFLQIDNMTDCLMMNIILSGEGKSPIYQAMMSEYCLNDTGNQGYLSIAKDTETLAQKGPEAMSDRWNYGRYWHGYQLILKPLLVFFDYSSIRIINYFILSSLSFLCLLFMVHRYDATVSLLFLLSLLLVGFPVVPMTIQFSTCFYIALLSMLGIMLCKKIRYNLTYFFFVIGGITSFMDYLTTPLLTLGLPLVVLQLDKIKEKKTLTINYILVYSLCWFIGYAMLWASKWLTASILTNVSIVDLIGNNVSLRLSNTIFYGGEQMMISDMFEKTIGSYWFLFFVLIFLLLFSALYLYCSHIEQKEFKKYRGLLLIAFLVPVWFLVLRNHSLQHIFFTWRSWLVTLFALLLFVYYTKPYLVWKR
jgi:hypothetical protein